MKFLALAIYISSCVAAGDAYRKERPDDSLFIVALAAIVWPVIYVDIASEKAARIMATNRSKAAP